MDRAIQTPLPWSTPRNSRDRHTDRATSVAMLDRDQEKREILRSRTFGCEMLLSSKGRLVLDLRALLAVQPRQPLHLEIAALLEAATGLTACIFLPTSHPVAHCFVAASRARDGACNRVAGARSPRHVGRRIAMYAMRRWSVRQARLLDRLYGAFEKILVAADPLFSFVGYRAHRAPCRRDRARTQRLLLRLPDVRTMRLVEYRHVMPDELSEEYP